MSKFTRLMHLFEQAPEALSEQQIMDLTKLVESVVENNSPQKNGADLTYKQAQTYLKMNRLLTELDSWLAYQRILPYAQKYGWKHLLEKFKSSPQSLKIGDLWYIRCGLQNELSHCQNKSPKPQALKLAEYAENLSKVKAWIFSLEK